MTDWAGVDVTHRARLGQAVIDVHDDHGWSPSTRKTPGNWVDAVGGDVVVRMAVSSVASVGDRCLVCAELVHAHPT